MWMLFLSRFCENSHYVSWCFRFICFFNVFIFTLSKNVHPMVMNFYVQWTQLLGWLHLEVNHILQCSVPCHFHPKYRLSLQNTWCLMNNFSSCDRGRFASHCFIQHLVRSHVNEAWESQAECRFCCLRSPTDSFVRFVRQECLHKSFLYHEQFQTKDKKKKKSEG